MTQICHNMFLLFSFVVFIISIVGNIRRIQRKNKRRKVKTHTKEKEIIDEVYKILNDKL